MKCQMIQNEDILSRLIGHDSLKIISFDIFDTLIVRPAINPRDIFYFLDKYYQKISGKMRKKISKIRIACEDELIREKGVENVTIDLIYEKVGKKTGLDKTFINNLKEKEVFLEIDLADLNQEMFRFLKRAKENGKKVILTSDMYLTSKCINRILSKFQIEYDTLYVSADIKKRKDKGDLYDEILYKENIKPSELFHIGDNENSDYLIPLQKGILAFHYVSHSLKTKKNLSNILISDTQKITSLFLGYLINEENKLASKENMKYTTLYNFGYYCIAPFLSAIMIHLLFSHKIQKRYDTLFFSSRDGYIPFKVYEMLRKAVGAGILGEYMYCGRRALNIACYNNNTLDYISSTYDDIKQQNKDYTIKDLFHSLDIVEYYTETDNYSRNGIKIESYVSNQKALSLEFDKRKKVAIRYFHQVFDNAKKRVMFDCGYNGSVSDYIYRLSKKKIDKIYMWETTQNKYIDIKNSTKTYSLFTDFERIKPFHLLFEELFSPLEPSCIGYKEENGKIFPVFDNSEIFSEEMKHDLTEIHKGIFDYTSKFCQYFASYLPYFYTVDYKSVFDYTMKHLFEEKDQSLNLMHNINFYDKYYDGNISNSLSNKLCTKNTKNSFKGNALMNQDFLFINESASFPDRMNIRLGLHIHLFYIDLHIDFLERLKDFPYPFDLFITISDRIYEKSLYAYFSPEVIPFLKQVTVIPVQNRGRDVAPWLIEMKNIHTEYDIFGHMHTKKNTAIGFGHEWRNYLLDNLIERNAVIDILNLFFTDTNLGIVYPPMYKDVYGAIASAGDSPFQELDLIKKYLSKIELPDINNYNEIHFSVGTMFWYRPHALKKMFYDNLSYDDFSQEPVGINGTLAHAIERLPSYVANNAGYTMKLYLNPKILKSVFYNQYTKYESDSHSLLSFLNLCCKKLYFVLLKLIPEHRLREKIDRNLRRKAYLNIKKLVFSGRR